MAKLKEGGGVGTEVSATMSIMMMAMERGITTVLRGSYLVDKRVRNQPRT